MIILFDIDSTLTTGSRWGAEAFDRAIAAVTGLEGTTRSVRFAGNIDALIVRDALTPHGRYPRDPGEASVLTREVLSVYRTVFAAGLEAAPYRALPCAREAVLAARASARVVGLATGNVEECAHGKLRSAGLGDLFATRDEGGVGGFGDEGETRADVVRAAIALGRAAGPQGEPVWVLGDTPEDVSAAHTAGAFAAGVATGRHDREALQRAGAERVYLDLRDLLAAPPW